MIENEARPVSETELVEFLRGLAKPKTFRDRFQLPPNRIADALYVRDASGYRRKAEACPMAVALRQEFPGHSWTVTKVRICDDITVKTPWYIRWFISRFDRGAYPNINRAYRNVRGTRLW